MEDANCVKRVAVGDIEIEYEEHGSGGRAFVLVHGFTGSRDDWLDVLPVLAEEGHTVALDQRGHGGSSNPGAGYHFDQLVADLAAFLDAVGIERCDLLGHSMGGMVALRFTLAHPERVASLVLMDTSAAPVHASAKRFFELGGRVIEQGGMAALYQVARKAAAVDPNRAASARRAEEAMGSERWWARIERKLLAMDPAAYHTLGVLLAEHESAVGRLGEITCPTLVVVGEDDAAFVAHSQDLADGIADASHAVIEGAAHSPQLENQPVWLDAIRSHLRAARGQ